MSQVLVVNFDYSSYKYRLDNEIQTSCELFEVLVKLLASVAELVHNSSSIEVLHVTEFQS